MAKHSSPPPRWADRLLAQFCPPYLLEELLGDLHEQFAVQSEAQGERKARLLYLLEILRFCRPYFLRRRFRSDSKYSTSYTKYTLIDSIRRVKIFLGL